MLRVTVHEDGTVCRLELAGKLGGPWVAETEHAWRSYFCSDKQIEIDIRQLTGVDDAGRELLSVMHQAGARLIAEGVAITALVHEITGDITGKQHFNGPNRRPRTRKGGAGPTFPDQESNK